MKKAFRRGEGDAAPYEYPSSVTPQGVTPSPKGEGKKKEFSKVAIGYLTGLWIAVGVAGLVIAVLNFALYGCADFEALYTYVGAPMSCGLVGYFVKAAIENREKIRGGSPSIVDDESAWERGVGDAAPYGEGSQRAE